MAEWGGELMAATDSVLPHSSVEQVGKKVGAGLYTLRPASCRILCVCYALPP